MAAHAMDVGDGAEALSAEALSSVSFLLTPLACGRAKESGGGRGGMPLWEKSRANYQTRRPACRPATEDRGDSLVPMQMIKNLQNQVDVTLRLQAARELPTIAAALGCVSDSFPAPSPNPPAQLPHPALTDRGICATQSNECQPPLTSKHPQP